MRLAIEIKKPADVLLALLLATTAFLVFLDLYHFFTGLLDEPMFDLEVDAGLGQTFRHFQEFWIVLMLFALAFRRWPFLCVSWGLLFLAYLLDDSLSLHEQIGLLLADRYDLPSLFGMRPQDLGEILVYGSWGVTLTGLVIVAHALSRYDAKRFSLGLFALMILLAAVSVGMDVAQGIMHHPWLHAAFGKAEETGAMIAVSLIVWYVFRHVSRADD